MNQSVRAICLLLVGTVSLFSADCVFTGAIDGLWSKPGNWSPAQVPAAGNSVDIPSGKTATVNVGSAALGAVTVEGSLVVSQTLQAASLASTGTVTLSNGTISGAVIVSGTVVGTNSSNTLSGATLAAGATLDLASVNAAQCSLNNAMVINGTVLLGSSDGTRWGRAYWSTATTSWTGTGSFVFGGSGNNQLSAQAYSTTLTIGSGITIHGSNGALNGNYGNTGTLINNGTITSDGSGTLTLGLWSWTNAGTVSATAGSTLAVSTGGTGSSSGVLSTTGGILTLAGSGAWSTSAANGVTASNGTLNLGGSWSTTGAGSIATAGSVINLGGTFTTAQALAVQHSGATTISITGAMNNASATLALGASTGSWYLNGGSITGGTVTGTPSARLIGMNNGSNLLDGVTLAAGATLDLASVNAAQCYLNNAMTIDGTVLLGSVDGTLWGRAYWNTATTSWTGTGSFVFGGSGNNQLSAQGYSTTLTIGSGITIHGTNGAISSNYGNTGTLVNNGTITSDGGGTLTLGLWYWTNNGSLSAAAGSTLVVNSGGTWSNTGTVSGASGSSVTLTNNGTGSNSGTISTIGGTLAFGGTGAWATSVSGGVTATNGTLSLGGSWSTSGAGTIGATGSSINLGGSFTTAQALAVQHGGATTISITGAMNNASATLPLGPATGSWYLNGGSVTGGTITGTANERLIGANNGSNVLDGVTLAASATLDLSSVNAAQCYLNNAMVINGAVLLGSTDGSLWGRAYWSTATTSWTGTGSFVFGGSGSNQLSAQAYSTTLTIGSGITIHGTNGAISGNYGNTGTLVNNGTIASDGGGTLTLNLWSWTNAGTLSATAGSALAVNSGGTWSNTGTVSVASGSSVALTNNGSGSNSGTISTTGGTLAVGGSGAWSNSVAGGIAATNGALSLGGAWSTTGAGTIATTDSSIDLGGTFTTAQALAVQHSGATTISITGAMNNASATLPLGPATGSWYLNGGSIMGGTITGTANERLIGLNNGSNVLDGVTLAASLTLDLSSVNAAQCYLNNAMVINGTVLLGSVDGTLWGRAYWSTATTSWTGTGSFVFGGSGSNQLSAQAYSTTLTIGSGITIHGTNGAISGNYGNTGALVNNGTIASDGGGTLTLNLWSWTNAGTLSATAGSALAVNSGGTWSNTGTVSGASGSSVALTNNGSGSNSGTISTTGGTLAVGGSGAWSNSVAGGIAATNGTLSLSGTWSNTGAGTIGGSGSSINLGGTFTTARALAVQHSGATTISITGAMNNASATLALGPSTGSWYLNGGSITGGTITGTANERLISLNNGSNVLDGVTLAASLTLDLSSVNAAQCYLNNAMVINGTVLLGSVDGTLWGRAYWSTATTSWTGTGSFVFGGSGSNQLSAQAYSTTLTIGSGIGIHGANGAVVSNYGSTGTLVNNGTIASDGGGTLTLNLWSWTNTGTLSAIAGSALAVNSGGTWSNTGTVSGASGSVVTLTNNGTGTSSGTLSSTGGTLSVAGTGAWTTSLPGGVSVSNGTLNLGGSWGASGSGTIVTTASAINLGGAFTTARALAVQHSGATTISITGAMNNASATLALGPATGSWYLNGGSITGGTITGTITERLIGLNNGSNVLDGVTLAASATLDLASVNAAQCYLNNAMVINGTVLLGSTDGSLWGRAYWSTTTTTWGGTGSFVFGDSGNDQLSAQAYSTTLTIGSGITIRGKTGAINANYGNTGTLINNGTIASDGAGGLSLSAPAFTNNGTIVVGAGTKQTWNCTGAFTQSAGGSLVIEIGGSAGGQFDRLSFSGGAAITLGGTVKILSTDGFTPTTATSVDIITIASGSIAGTATVPHSYGLAYSATKVTAIGLNGLVGPTVVLTSSASDPATSGPIPVTATFSVPVTGFSSAGLSPTGATVANMTGSGANYTFDLVPASAQGTVGVTLSAGAAVSSADLTNTASNTLTRVYNGIDPTISGLNPATGTTSGGTRVVISGTGFMAGSTQVTIGGAAATVTAVTPTTISCTAPAHGAGGATVQVTVAGRSVQAIAAYTYATPAAADVVFTGSVSTVWNNASNWSPAAVPTIGQKVDIPVGKTCDLNVTTPVLGAVTVEGTLNLQGGFYFQASSLANDGTVNLKGAILKVATVTGGALIASNSVNTIDGVALNADLDLTQVNGAQVSITNTVTLGDGQRISVGASDGSTYGYVLFVPGTGNTAALATSGSASIVLGSSGSNLIRDSTGNTAASIGAGITVTGGTASIYVAQTGSTLSIAGTIDAAAAGQTITLGNNTDVTSITSSGILRASNGVLTILGSWANSGALSVSGGTMNLGGSFGDASVQDARWTRSGGTVNVTGSLTIGGANTLTHTAAMGEWRLNGSTISGGTLTSTGGTLVGYNTTNVLSGVTLNANLDLTQVNGAQATITNTVTLGSGRTIAVGATGGGTYGYLFFVGGTGNVATLAASASASVVLGASGNNLIRDAAASTQATIGSGITISGGAGSVYVYQGGSTLTVAGTIDAATTGQTVTVGNNGDVTTIAATGIVRASGGILTLAGSWVNAGKLVVSAGTMNLGGSFGDASVQDARWTRSGGTVNVTGSLTIGGANPLTHTSAMGVWQLAGSTISGGTLTSTGGTLVGLNATNTLSGVTLNANLDLTQVNGAQATITNTVTLGSGRTIAVGAAGGGTYGYLLFVGGTGNVATLAASASASVVLGASGSNLLRDNAANTQATIGSGITISGGAGSVYVYQGGSTLTVAGTIDAATTGQTVTVGNNGDVTTIAATGIVRASGGILTLAGSWVNAGKLVVSAGTMNLGGSFGDASVQDARWTRSGGTVNVTGSLTIGGANTLTHTSAMGVWQLAGSTISGGTLTSTGGTLVGLNATNTLSGVTLNANLDLTQVNGAQATITNTVTLGSGRTIAVGAAGGGTYGYLLFVGGTGNVATLAASASASVVLGASGSNLLRDNAANTQATIGSGITISGGAGSVYVYQGGSTLTVAGTIDAATTGQTVTVGNNGDVTTIAATGIVRASGGILTLAGSWVNAGKLVVSAGTMNLGGSFGDASVQDARWTRSGGTVNVTGSLTIGGANTLTHTSAMGVWQLAGSTISGGTLTSTGGTLVGLNATNTLSGVTLNANLDLTQVNGAQATITNTVTLGSGRTIAVGAAGGGTYGYLLFVGGTGNVATLAASASASVVLGASGSNLLRDNAANTQATIGAGVTVSGGQGSVYVYQGGSTLAIAGTVDAASPAKTVIVGNNASPTSVSGTLGASAGILTLAGTWANTGTIATQTGTVNLGGAFGYGSVLGARWARSASDAVNLTGLLTIGTGNTLILDAQTGSWQVAGGTLKDGTLSDAGSRLVFTGNAGALDGVTIPIGTVIDLGLSNGASCYLNNGVTINGTIRVGRTDGGTYGRLYWSSATAAWGGSGDILFGASSSNSWSAQSGAGPLAIAAPLLIHGQNASITATVAGSSIGNNGTLSTDVPGGVFSLSAISFANNGTIIVGKDSIQNWSCSRNFSQSAGGILELDIGGAGLGQSDRLAFSGTSAIALGGTIRLVSSSGYVPTPSTSVDIITIGGGSITGSFAAVQGAYSISYAATKVTAVGLSGATAPTAALSSTSPDPAITGPIPVTATFSTAVTGFSAASLLPTNATVSGFSGSGAVYTFNLVPVIAQGTVGVSIPAGAARNGQLLTNPAAGPLQRLYNGVSPTITGISPTVGTYAGGTVVTISGTGYLGGSTAVTFGGVAASVTAASATSITCVAPAGSAGSSVDIQVSVAGRSALATAAFTYSSLALPVISSLAPASAAMAGGVTVTITGANLAGTTSVTFAGAPATGVQVIDANTVTCVVPAFAGSDPSSVDVTLTTGIGDITGSGAFYYGNPPTVGVTSASPVTRTSPIAFTIVFASAVTGFDASGLVVTNGTLGALTGNGVTFGVPVVPTAEGPVTLAVAANAASDVHGLRNLASAAATVAYDTTAPTVAITPGSGTFIASPIVFTLAFSEPVVGLTAGGFTVVNGTAGAVGAVDPTHYTVAVAPTGPGTVGIGLAAAAVTDVAGNANAASATASVSYAVNPTVVVTAPGSPTNASPMLFTCTFSAPVTGFGPAGVSVVNGTVGPITGSGTTYTVPVTPIADGAVDARVLAGAAIDGNTLGNTVSNLASATYDGTRPSVAITPGSGTFSTSPIAFTLAFSEAVSGPTTGSLVVGNGIAGAVSTVDGSHYTVTVTPISPGAVTLALSAGAVSDAAGNGNAPSATASVTFITTHPTVVVASTGPATNVSPIVFTLTFSAPVSGLTSAGLAVGNGSAGSITGNGAVYSVPVTPSANGPVTVQVLADAAEDGNSEGNLASNLASVVYDTVAPTASVLPSSGSSTTSPIVFTIAFSEPVSGFAAAGLTVGNGTTGAVAGSGASYTVQVTPLASGAVTLAVGGAAAVDSAGNASIASSTASISFSTVLTLQPLPSAVGIVGRPFSAPVAADSSASTATVSISAVTDLLPLGLALTPTGNGRATLAGIIPEGLAAGDYPISLSASDGYSTTGTGFTLTVVASTTAAVAATAIPLTGAQGDARYTTIGVATEEGIRSVLAALAGKDAGQARAFAFDGSTQAYVELPGQPGGGLTVYQGLFIASRVPLAIDLTGIPVPMPGALMLQPGWNLLGVPPIHDGIAIRTEHPWEDFQLQTADGVPVANPEDLIGTPGGPLTSSEPWLWNGSGYVQVSTLSTGIGYWFKNNGAQPLRLVRTPAQTNGTGSVRATAERGVRVRLVTDRGTPPAPPAGGSHKDESSGGGCGTGSGIGLVGLLFLSLYRRRLGASDRRARA